MTEVPGEGAGSEPDLVRDEPGDPFAEERELKQDEAENRAGSGDAAPPDQPWT